jgi:hypothetical protein
MADEGPLVPPQPDPHDPAMEARVQALEAIVGEIRSELKAMRQDIAELKTTMRKLQLDLAEVKGRISQIPTMIQLVTLVVTLVIAIWGMAFATLRFAGVH